MRRFVLAEGRTPKQPLPRQQQRLHVLPRSKPSSPRWAHTRRREDPALWTPSRRVNQLVR